MPFLRRLSVLVIAAALTASSASFAQEIGVDRVLEGEDLRTMGITQLAEALRYLHAGRMITIDGFSRTASLNGLASFHEAGPALYVDGHPVDLSYFGTDRLNLIGIPIEAIDRVEIVNKPALIHGTFAGRGAIHVHTREDVEGVRADAAVSVTSEVGDPGPFAYLDDTQNTDTQGPNGRALVEVGSRAGGARVAGVYHRHYLTKPAILPRLLTLQDFSDAPVIDVLAPSFSASWANAGVGADVIVLGAAGRLYPHLPYASREISANVRAATVSGVFRHDVGSRTALRHRLTAAALRAEHPDDSEVPYLWEEESVSMNSAMRWSLERRVVHVGAMAGFERARSASSAARERGALYAAVSDRMSETVEYQGGGMLATDWTNAALKAFAGITMRTSPKHRGNLYLAVIGDLPDEQSGVDGWAHAGADVPLLPDNIQRPEERVGRRVTGDAEWSWSPNTMHEIAGGVGIRIAADTYTFRRAIEPDSAGYRTETLSYHYAEGTNGVVWMEYVTRLLPGRQRLFWHVESTLGGDDRFQEIWRAVPDARLGIFAYVPLAPDFEIEASLVHQTGSTWDEFEGVADVVAEVSGSTLLDAAFYKRLLAGRAHVRLAFRNLLREDVRFHPIGDVFDLSARIDVRVEFGKSR